MIVCDVCGSKKTENNYISDFYVGESEIVISSGKLESIICRNKEINEYANQLQVKDICQKCMNSLFRKIFGLIADFVNDKRKEE